MQIGQTNDLAVDLVEGVFSGFSLEHMRRFDESSKYMFVTLSKAQL